MRERVGSAAQELGARTEPERARPRLELAAQRAVAEDPQLERPRREPRVGPRLEHGGDALLGYEPREDDDARRVVRRREHLRRVEQEPPQVGCQRTRSGGIPVAAIVRSRSTRETAMTWPCMRNAQRSTAWKSVRFHALPSPLTSNWWTVPTRGGVAPTSPSAATHQSWRGPCECTTSASAIARASRGSSKRPTRPRGVTSRTSKPWASSHSVSGPFSLHSTADSKPSARSPVTSTFM